MSGIKLKTGTVSKERTVNLSVGSRPKDILVFVPGTTDPVNATEAQHQANKTYWDDNEKLLAALKELKKEFLDLHVQNEFFSWSGDNAKAERAKAGDRLRLLLYARTTQPPVYKGFIDKPVSLHLIGHSHGGNVINEFTKSIKKNKDFPKLWKIKSITYLSTPFFSKKSTLHQLDSTYFHPQCRIINVRNHFDLTQRVIADFTLFELPPVAEAVKKQSKIFEGISEIKKFFTKIAEELKTWTWINDSEEGPALWGSTVSALSIIQGAIISAIKLVAGLHKDFPDVISAKAEKILKTFLTDLLTWSATALIAYQTRLKQTPSNWSDLYSTATFLADLHPLLLVKALTAFLQFDGKTHSGELITLIDEVLVGRLDVVDDTRATPEEQIPKTFKKDVNYFDISVRPYDRYDGMRDDQYTKLVDSLEERQKTYVANPNAFNRGDFVFTLLAQLDHRALTNPMWPLLLAVASEFLPEGFDVEAKKLTKTLWDYDMLLRPRDTHAVYASDYVAGKVASLLAPCSEENRKDMTDWANKHTDKYATQFPEGGPTWDRWFRGKSAEVETTIKELIEDLNKVEARYGTWLANFQKSQKLADTETMGVLLWRIFLHRKSFVPNWKKWETMGMEQQRGSLGYLAVVSHSVSRQDIYPEVREKLIPAFESGKNPGYKVTTKK